MMMETEQALDVPQSQPLSADQLTNSAGGYGWKVDDIKRLRRFLCLGSEGGTFYTGEKELGLENAQCIQRLLDQGKGKEVLSELVSFSTEGRAAKQNPIIFALAMLVRQDKDAETKKLSYEKVQEICRIPTHLFTFIEFCEKLSRGTGWGRAHRRAIINWYLRYRDNPKRLALQVTKYKNRNGWSHRDVMRLAHPKPDSDGVAAVIRYIMKGIDQAKADFLNEESAEIICKTFAFLQAVEDVKTVTQEEEVVELIKKHQLVREHVPTNFLNSVQVWKTLLENMPMTALIRNLGKMTSIGLLQSGNEQAALVKTKLQDTQALKGAKIHPFNVLVALYTYKQGKGEKGKLTWQPCPEINAALNDAFYKCFKHIEATDQRYLLALDVSGSMSWGGVNGSASITPRDASAALAMVTARTEKNYKMVGFSTTLQSLNIDSDMSLEKVIEVMDRVPMGGTDCAQPMLWATKKKLQFDIFVVYTDCETWFGSVHPAEALRQYRQDSGIWNAKLIVCGMTSNGFTIADPEDPGMLDMAGFDSSGPEVMRNFSLGLL